jgi:hypothetical protein
MALPTKKAVAMKTSAMKSARAMKAKRVSKIARGKLGRAQVLRGSKEKTLSGLTKDQLMRNKRGKIVSKKASAVSRRRFEKSTIKVWAECVFAARKALNLKGFVAINGKLAEGKALYAKAKALYSARQ